ncbi:MAG: hypothetical protein LAP40_00465 [Acidobacteriia bacterium]|nr:hypothetical protein [Terriglobia bacterium]
MRLNTIATIVLLAAPALAFLLVLNRSVPLVPLDGIDARCTVCGRKATRTLKRAADELRTKGFYVYRTSEYAGGIPAWCDQHGPSKTSENATKAYFAAILAFAMVGTAYERARRSS